MFFFSTFVFFQWILSLNPLFLALVSFLESVEYIIIFLLFPWQIPVCELLLPRRLQRRPGPRGTHANARQVPRLQSQRLRSRRRQTARHLRLVCLSHRHRAVPLRPTLPPRKFTDGSPHPLVDCRWRWRQGDWPVDGLGLSGGGDQEGRGCWENPVARSCPRRWFALSRSTSWWVLFNRF